MRRFFKVSSFGYLIGAELDFTVTEFSVQSSSGSVGPSDKLGLTITKSLSDSLSPYLEGHERRCYLTQSLSSDSVDEDMGLISMIIDREAEQVVLSCSPSLTRIQLTDKFSTRAKRAVVPLNASNSANQQPEAPYAVMPVNPVPSAKPAVVVSEAPAAVPAAAPVVVASGQKTAASDPKPVNPEVKKVEEKVVEAANEFQEDKNDSDQDPGDLREDAPKSDPKVLPPVDDTQDKVAGDSNSDSSCFTKTLKLNKRVTEDNRVIYSFGFKLVILKPEEMGLYSIFFHSCPNYEKTNDALWTLIRTNLSIDIIERNVGSYLSGGEIPLPELYFFLSLVFAIAGCIWIQVLRSKRHETFQIHYLMALLVFVKSAALLFHGINYHFISIAGSQIETWAVLYYSTHLLKGALLFITLVLIGTGWAFVKQVLSDRDKQVFMIVIPLQVLANIAEIITEASEEGAVYHNKWREIFILVDLLCCGAILFPVVWSIRHLQEAAHVDGKAATNLKKLKLFRRFYVIVVCYIYFTRIIVYLLRMTLPFQYEWMDVLCQHVAILIFFVLTGYHFQPTPQNPYFRVSQDEDLEMEEV